MIAFVVTMAVSLLDPLRLIPAIGSGFIPNRWYALLSSMLFSLGGSAFSASVAAKYQSSLGMVHWVAPLATSVLLTAFVHWLRHRGKKPAEIGAQEVQPTVQGPTSPPSAGPRP